MEDSRKSRVGKIGAPPGTLVYVGDRFGETTSISVFQYNEKSIQQTKVSNISELPDVEEDGMVSWIKVTGLGLIDLCQQLGEHFKLHPLTLEDIFATDQRPKLENYKGYEYIVLKALQYDSSGKDVTGEQLSFILRPNYVISFQEQPSPLFDHIQNWIRDDRGVIRKQGAHYLFYALLDAVVDQYFAFLEVIGEEIEALEHELVTEPTDEMLQAIYQLKNSLILTRKAVWPLREVINRLTREESPEIREQTNLYIRDIDDHIIRAIETVETYRDTLSSMLDIYLSSMSNRMSEVMKVLTIIATIFIPLTLIVGIYGMDLPNMPERIFPWSYPIVLGIMLGAAIVMLMYFRKKRWL